MKSNARRQREWAARQADRAARGLPPYRKSCIQTFWNPSKPMQEVKLDPSRRIGVTSDTHYGHRNIISYCLRPFMTDDERAALARGERIVPSDDTLRRQNDALVKGINDTLGPDDILIHAGDVAWKDQATLQEFRDRLNVREIYVAAGNHDVDAELRAVFRAEFVHERFVVQVGSQRAVIDHYPGSAWLESHRATWLLFGHRHGGDNAKRRQSPAFSLSIDVGVDSHEFKPWLWAEELVPLFAGRKPLFDAWAKREYPGKDGGGMAPTGPV